MRGCLAAFACALAGASAHGAEVLPALPPAPALECSQHRYVDAAHGHDKGPGTADAPWASLEAADNGYPTVPVAGECIEVRPGRYVLPHTLVISHGGNAATPLGYVVYRSVVPGGAHLVAGPGIDTGSGGDMLTLWAPYVAIIGFEIDGDHAHAGGSGINGCANGGQPGNIAHHMIAIGNVIHDLGGSGISSCSADFITWRGNTVFSTASTNQFQMSALNLWKPRAVAGSPTPAGYGIVIADNDVHDNGEGPAIPAPHTDGNGIIIDTTLGSSVCATCGTAYPGRILVQGNVTYRNGGGGVHVFLSRGVDVIGNIAYGNTQDALNPGTARGDLSSVGSQDVVWTNNIAQAVPGAGPLARNAPVATYAVQGFPNQGQWTGNITYGAPNHVDASFDPAANSVGVDPRFIDPAGGDFHRQQTP